MSQHHDDNRRIVEDAPTMRSVSMMPSMAPPIPLRSSPAAMFGGKQSMRPYGALAPEVGKNNKVGQVVPVVDATWKVAAPLPIPSYYPLERTHVFVPDASSVEVSQRIADCLCKESIAATFDDKEALALAETIDCLKFAIRLWEAKGQVVAEVQRTAGCCFLYNQTAKTVLRAAKYGDSAPAVKPAPLPRSLPKCVPQVSPQEWEACAVEGLEIASNALKPGNCYDAHLLAMKSLVQLTEASKCREFCVKHILAKDSELLATILCLIQSSRLSPDSEIDPGDNDAMIREYSAVMHRQALVTLANCLQFAVESGSAASVVPAIPDLTCDTTLSALVQDVASASTRPHDATAACRCLQSLCRCSSEAKELVLQLDVVGHVEAAQQCRHVVLQKECSLFIREL